MSILYVGIDSGGSTSKLKARSVDGSTELSLVSAGANPKRVGPLVAADRLAELIVRADTKAGGEPALVVQVGAAGVGSSGDQAQLAVAVHERLARLLGNDRSIEVDVCTDAELALSAAFGTESGVVIIAGTGSISICRCNSGEVAVRGGWGFRLGDVGGGYHIGLGALKRLAADIERRTHCDLSRLIADTFGLAGRDELIAFVYDQDRTAEVAPFVIQSAGLGDEDASEILSEAVLAITEMLVRINESDCIELKNRYVLSGGLFREPHFRDRVHRHIRETLPDWTNASPRLASAVDAAIDLAIARHPA